MRFWRDHRWVPERSSEYLDGGLPDRDRARTDRHLADCPDCRSLVDGLRAIINSLGAIGTDPSEPIAQAMLISLQGQLIELPVDDV